MVSHQSHKLEITGSIPVLATKIEKLLWKTRLEEWEEELKHNKYGMQYLSQRVIDVTKQEIRRRWPGELKK